MDGVSRLLREHKPLFVPVTKNLINILFGVNVKEFENSSVLRKPDLSPP